MDPTQAAEDNQTFYQEGAGEGTEAPDSAVLGHNGEPKDVEYASIDFSALKNRPRKAATQQEAAATEYAEIKRQAKVNVEENGREEDDTPTGKDEKGTETGNGVPEEEKREEESVYSNVKEVLNEIWGIVHVVCLLRITFLSRRLLCSIAVTDFWRIVSANKSGVPLSLSTTYLEMWPVQMYVQSIQHDDLEGESPAILLFPNFSFLFLVWCLYLTCMYALHWH